ncbi:MAG: AAA family ATPase, partial [Clostridia bacterium]|nr:AAA family ATPase [Clostridia bacterium]
YERYLTKNENPKIKPVLHINFSKNDFEHENNHLQMTLEDIDKEITAKREAIVETEKTWWMDHDQKLQEGRKIKSNAEKLKSIEELNKLKQSPYFGRIDVKSEEYSDEVFYIGAKDFTSNNTSILSVWSEFGKYYRNNRLLNFNVVKTNYTVSLRRRIDIRDGKLIACANEYKAGSSAGRANVTDPFLMEVLKRKRAEKQLTNIISTIQQKQNDIIDYDFHKNIIVQGCAGSGKTMILLHRLANMKFNEKQYDFGRVKIITPNDNFNLFIGGLTENLGISGIAKTTLSGYYISLLARYHADIAKGGSHSGREREKYETELLADEGEVSLEIRKYIYSEQFFNSVRSAMEKIRTEDSVKAEKNRRTIGALIGRLPSDSEESEGGDGSKKRQPTSIIERVLKSENIDLDYKKNYNCILYIKTLILYFYFGALSVFYDTLLCIDEAQDIAPVQFDLLKSVNGKNLKFNFYGDINQQLEDNVNIGEWDAVKGKFGAESFELNENYRNSENIINFYNGELGFKDVSFGLKTRAVTKISEQTVRDIMALSVERGNRTAVICDDKQTLARLSGYNSVAGKVAADKVSLLSVREAKGLEFDTVIVFPKGLNRNGKYIAFTRALSDLFIVN